MRTTQPAPKPTEEENTKFIFICNRGEFLMESKETQQKFALVVKKEVAPSLEVSKKMKPILEEFKKKFHVELPEELPPMREIQHYDTSIIRCFENLFMQKKSTRDEIFKFFKFASPTISMWAQRILQGMSNFISNRTL